MVLLAILAVGILFFQVGKAAVLKSQAQTAADAAALAGAREIRDQLLRQYATFGATSLGAIDYAAVEAQMAQVRQAQRRHDRRQAGLHGRRRQGHGRPRDQKLGDDAKDIDEENRKGEAQARARVKLALGGVGGLGGANMGPLTGGSAAPGRSRRSPRRSGTSSTSRSSTRRNART